MEHAHLYSIWIQLLADNIVWTKGGLFLKKKSIFITVVIVLSLVALRLLLMYLGQPDPKSRQHFIALVTGFSNRIVSMKVEASEGNRFNEREYKVNIDEVGGIDENPILPGIQKLDERFITTSKLLKVYYELNPRSPDEPQITRIEVINPPSATDKQKANSQ